MTLNSLTITNSIKLRFKMKVKSWWSNFQVGEQQQPTDKDNLSINQLQAKFIYYHFTFIWIASINNKSPNLKSVKFSNFTQNNAFIFSAIWLINIFRRRFRPAEFQVCKCLLCCDYVWFWPRLLVFVILKTFFYIKLCFHLRKKQLGQKLLPLFWWGGMVRFQIASEQLYGCTP